MKHMLNTLALATALIGGAAQAQSWSLYDYTATVDANTTIGGTTFAAGSQITGDVYVLNGVTPTNGGWGFAGEVALYSDSVNSFSFEHALLNVTGTGAGNAQVDNNRRLTKSGSAWQDVFMASLPVEATTTFSSVALGGGVKSVGFELRTNFGSPSSAITSLALPGTVNVPMFAANRNLTLSFNDNSVLNATVQSMTVSQVSQISAVPEPSSFALAGLGLAGLALLRRRQTKA